MPRPTFDYARMSVEVRKTLQMSLGPDADIRMDEGEAGTVYVQVVSDCFNGRSERAKQDMVWDALRQNLKEESQAVALVLALGTEQI